MADHLPECIQSPGEPVGVVCICDRIRACEARVRKEVATPTWSYGVGREAGIELARDAVAALGHDTYCATRDENYQRPCNCPVDDALAAIDALGNNQ